MKTIVRILTLAPLTAYLVYCVCHFILNEINPTYLDCGKVVSKSSDEVAIKHGSRTELYLNVQFNKTGFKSMNCDPTTYFSNKVGDNVCFNLRTEVSIWYELANLIGIIVLSSLGVIAIVFFIGYILPDDWF